MGTKRSISLVVPGLLQESKEHFNSLASEFPDVKALQRLLCRAKVTHADTAETSLNAVLFSLFSYKLPNTGDLPVAPLCYAVETDNPQVGWYFKMDPVCLEADRGQLLMLGDEQLDVSVAESRRLIAEINQLFHDENWSFCLSKSNQWYLFIPQDPQLKTVALDEVLFKNIDEFLPTGDGATYWHKILNELQMLLHGSSVNFARESQGRQPINSVWMWGGGQLLNCDQFGTSIWHKVYSEHVLCNALAEFNHIQASPVEPIEQCVHALTDTENGLILLQGLHNATLRSDVYTWRSELQILNDDWAAPLIDALSNGNINELSIYPCNGQVFTIDRSKIKHWWKRSKSISTFLI